MTIHSTHPFADAEPDPVRRFRGRLGGAVTLWTAGDGGARAGLTVSSFLVANGEPASVLALVDPDSDLLETVRETGRCVVQALGWGDRALAEMFAGTSPAPGGPFAHGAFVSTPWGPRLASTTAWAGVSAVAEQVVGWSVLLTCRLDRAEVTEETGPGLGHRRGRFFALGSGG